MSKQIVVDGLLTSYSQTGKGQDVLLLHGWGDSKETYSALAETLSKQYKLTAVDLPGFGKTEPPHEAWNLDNYASFLEKFTEKTKLEPKAVVGHSNGGALAIVALVRGKLKTSKLILLAPSGVRDKGGLKRLLFKLAAKTGKVLTFWLPANQKRRLQQRFYGTIGSDMMAAPHIRETFKRTVRQDIQAEAASLTVPTLFVYGTNDKATPVYEVGSILHSKVKNSKLELINGAGHFVHHDNPTEVRKLIQGFLK